MLFWNDGVPVAAVPVETYRLVASPVLPSIPLFTFAGYLLVAGGANLRLLRVYQALLGWLPGGLAITTAVVCAIFTWAGSGVTILAMGGLLLPMLVKARYPENFSIGLINASGSLGLLFPPSLPVILYGIYARTPDRLAVRGRISSRAADGQPGFGVGRVTRPSGIAPNAPASPRPRRPGPRGPPSGNWPFPRSC